MRRSEIVAAVFVALGCLALTPATAHAQSAIAGVVKDTSGAVLPGVTVEASSDVLIEKTRSVVTDGEGQYKIVDLRPGTYVVTFTLPGFQTYRRENVELPTNFTSVINAEMRVGSIEESVTVAAQSPVVDVQSAVHTSVLNREAIDNIPTGHTIQGIGQLVVGVNLNLPDTGGARAMQQTYMSTHGMTSANNTVLVDGMMVNGLQGDGAIQSYFNDAMNQEVSYQTSGIGADTSAGGVRLNMIPREGGNTFSGSFNTTYRPGTWQANNVTDRLRNLGLTTGNSLDRIIDDSFGEGGPLKKDKVWFYGSARYFSVNNFIPNTFYADGSKGIDDQRIRSALVRLTWQITPKNKFAAYWDEVDKYRGHDMQAFYDPATAAIQWFSPAYHTASAKWTSTVTNKLLVEGGYSNNTEDYTNSYQPGVEQPRGSSAWYTNTAQVESDLGGEKTAFTAENTQSPLRYAVTGAVSYVTGSHNIKVGVQDTWGHFGHTLSTNGDEYRVYKSTSTGIPYSVPAQVVIRNTPLTYAEALDHDLGFYGQDAWTLKKLTVNVGIRYELLKAKVLAGSSPAGRFVGARNFAEIDNLPNWKNWAPRFAAVYDVFGNAKTAIKYSVNRYNQQRTTGIAALYNPLVGVTQALTWKDVNGNDQPDGEMGCTGYPSATCEVDYSTVPSNFGTKAFNEYGNYPRTYDIEHGLEFQHEITSRLSGTFSWFHGRFYNQIVTINRSLQTTGDPAANPNYTPFTIYNPLTGAPITVYGLKAAAKSLPVNNLDTYDPKHKTTYNAFNFEFRLRPGHGAQLFGGLAVERQLDVNCTAPDNPNSLLYCDDTQNHVPFNKNLRLSGSYPLAYGITLSGSLQSNASPNSTRTMVITAATKYPSSCPAPCPAGQTIVPAGVMGQSSLTVNILPPAATRVERINEFDLKLAKTFKVQRVTVSPTFEVFNIINADTIISYITTNSLSSSYLHPNSILQPRMIGIGAQVKW